MKLYAFCSGFDGENKYKPGIISTSVDHAKMIVRLGNGVMANDDDSMMSVDESIQKLRIESGYDLSAIKQRVDQFVAFYAQQGE